MHHHERGAPFGPGQLTDALEQVVTQGHFDLTAPVRGHRRTGPVETQPVLLRQCAQGVPPEGEFAGEHAVRVVGRAQHPLLPYRVVRVLHGQRLKHASLGPGQPRLVRTGQVTEEDTRRAAVRRDVVEEQEQDGVPVFEVEQGGPQRVPGPEVEPVPGRRVQVAVQRGRSRRPALDDDPGSGGRLDALPRLPVARREHGAQRRMTLHDVVERGFQGIDVRGASQAYGHRHVVRGAPAVQLGEQPQAALGERDGAVRPVARLARDQGRQRGPPLQRGDVLREACGGGVLEHVPDGQPHAQHIGHVVGEAGRQQRVPAMGEEAVVHTHRLRGAQHPAEEGNRHLFQLRLRHPLGAHQSDRLGQCALVDLPVRHEGEAVERGEVGGDEVFGQSVGEVAAELGRVSARHDVGGELVLVLGDDGLGDLRVGEECGFDFGGFDAEAADLDLVVGAAFVVEASVVVEVGEVAGAVEAGAGGAVRVGYEAGGGEVGPVEVAVGQTVAGYVQLTGGTRRAQPQRRIEDVEGLVDQRGADRNHGVRGVGGLDDVRGGVDHRLCRPVPVDHLDAGSDGLKLVHVYRGRRLTHRVRGRDRVEGLGVFVGEVVEEAGRQEQGGDAVLGGQLCDERGLRLLPGLQDDACAVEQRAPEFEAEGVPRDGGGLEVHLIRTRRQVGLPDQRRYEVAVRGDDALRAARGARREHHAGEVVAVDRHTQVARVVVGHRVRALHTRNPLTLKAARQPRMGDKVTDRGLVRRRPQTLVGEVRVEQHVSGAGLEYGDERGREGGVAFEQDAGELAPAQAAFAQVVGPAVGGGVELRVRVAALAVDQRDRIRDPCHLLLEALHE